MTILRIESVIYGVDDLQAGARFFNDVGIEQVSADERLVRFRTPANQVVELRKWMIRRCHAGVRRIRRARNRLGRGHCAGLEEVRRELVKDREVTRDATRHAAYA